MKIGVEHLTEDECDSLETLDLPPGLATIKFNAFKGCTFSSSIIIPEGCFSFEGNTA
jgi:hypothetical protein